MKHFVNKFIWVYLAWGETRETASLSMWTSPMDIAPFDEKMFPTPHVYTLSRGDIRYTLKSEVVLSQQTARDIAEDAHNEALRISKKNRNRIAVNRR